MDQDLKQYLDDNFRRIDERFTEINVRLAAIDERFIETDKRIEKVETSLLGAFYGWARPMEIRVSGMTNVVHGFDERLALAEQRIADLERRRAS
jgi:hypothetical protein